MTNVDIRSLAKLARLQVNEEEVAKLEKEIPKILEMVEAIQAADVSSVKEERPLRNVMREDSDAHESGLHTEELLAAAPAQKNDRVVVKQVISRKK